MIKVTIHLDSARGAEHDKTWKLEIRNDGTGNESYGNYNVLAYRGVSAGKSQAIRVWRTGTIRSFPRHLGVHQLLREAITSLLNEDRSQELDDDVS